MYGIKNMLQYQMMLKEINDKWFDYERTFVGERKLLRISDGKSAYAVCGDIRCNSSHRWMSRSTVSICADAYVYITMI